MHNEHANRFDLTNSFEPATEIRELTSAEVDDVAGGAAGLLLAAGLIGLIYLYDAYQIYKAVK